MNVLEAVEKRRAIKAYDPSHCMTDAEVKTLLDAARLSPTSFNIQNWRFVVVQNPELRQQMRDAAWNQAQVTDASLLIVLCADLNAWKKEPQRYWRFAPQSVQDMIVPMIFNFYEARGPQTQRDEAMRSVGIAAQTIMLAAKDIGYDTCPMVGFDPDAVAKIINLPSDHVVGMIITVGKAIEDARPRSGPLDENDVVIYDKFA